MNIKSALFAIALSALAATSAVQAQGATKVPQAFSASTLTRAEVRADAAAWRNAGLADEWKGEQTPDIYSTEYRSKLASYAGWVAQNANSPRR